MNTGTQGPFSYQTSAKYHLNATEPKKKPCQSVSSTDILVSATEIIFNIRTISVLSFSTMDTSSDLTWIENSMDG